MSAGEWLRNLVVRDGVVIGGSADAPTFLAHEEEIAARYPHFSYLKLTGGARWLDDGASREALIESLRDELDRVLASGRVKILYLDEARLVWQDIHEEGSESVAGTLVEGLISSGRLATMTGLYTKLLDEPAIVALLGLEIPLAEFGLTYFNSDMEVLAAFENAKLRPRRLELRPSTTLDDEIKAMLRSPLLSKVEELTTDIQPELFAGIDLPPMRVVRV